MLTDSMTSPWNFYTCPSKRTLWLTGHIRRSRKLWRGKRVPFRTSEHPYWSDYTHADPTLYTAFDWMMRWGSHVLRCRLWAYNDPFRLAFCMGAHPRLGRDSAVRRLDGLQLGLVLSSCYR